MRDALIAEILAETGIVTFQQVRYRLNRSYVAVLSVIAVLIIIILSLLLSLIRYVFCSQPHSQHSSEEDDAVGPAGSSEVGTIWTTSSAWDCCRDAPPATLCRPTRGRESTRSPAPRICCERATKACDAPIVGMIGRASG